MKDAAVIILSLYALANAGIIYYFFIYKAKEADREYEKRLKDIRKRLVKEYCNRGSH
jgi:hypothetical protein